MRIGVGYMTVLLVGNDRGPTLLGEHVVGPADDHAEGLVAGRVTPGGDQDPLSVLGR